MGYGKILAAREAPRGRDIRLVWTSLPGNSENVFWRDFCRALKRTFPKAPDIPESLLRLGYPRDAVRLDAARELRAATGGWISALHLYLLHYGEHSALSRPTAVTALVDRRFSPACPKRGQRPACALRAPKALQRAADGLSARGRRHGPADGDDESALAVLENEISRNLVHEKSRFFHPLLQRCPDELLARHMGAAFQHAIAVFMNGDFAAFGARLGWIGARCAAGWNFCSPWPHHRLTNALLGRPTGLFEPESPWTIRCLLSEQWGPPLTDSSIWDMKNTSASSIRITNFPIKTHISMG